jgi:hypothetical protein
MTYQWLFVCVVPLLTAIFTLPYNRISLYLVYYRSPRNDTSNIMRVAHLSIVSALFLIIEASVLASISPDFNSTQSSRDDAGYFSPSARLPCGLGNDEETGVVTHGCSIIPALLLMSATSVLALTNPEYNATTSLRNDADYCSKARVPCVLDDDEEAGVVVCCKSRTGRTFVMCVEQNIPQQDYHLLNHDSGDECGCCDSISPSPRFGGGIAYHRRRSDGNSAFTSSGSTSSSLWDPIKTATGRCYKKSGIRRHRNSKHCKKY